MMKLDRRRSKLSCRDSGQPKKLPLSGVRLHLVIANSTQRRMVYREQSCSARISVERRGAMDYAGQYKVQILEAIQSIDLAKVRQAIQIFRAARTHGRRIFVCGAGGTDSMAPQFLCDLVKEASFNRSSRFRILALSDQSPKISSHADDIAKERVFVEQLKNFAEPEDVVMGICTSGSSPDVVNALEYASWIGCRTIAVTGSDGGKLAEIAELNIQVPVTHQGSIEDAHVIICHMIGYYFVDADGPEKW